MSEVYRIIHWDRQKKKNYKVHDKNPSSLLNIYHSTITFQGIVKFAKFSGAVVSRCTLK